MINAPKSNARHNRKSAEVYTKIGVIDFFRQSPRHELGQLHLSYVRIELSTERQVEFGKLKLLTTAAVYSAIA